MLPSSLLWRLPTYLPTYLPIPLLDHRNHFPGRLSHPSCPYGRGASCTLGDIPQCLLLQPPLRLMLQPPLHLMLQHPLRLMLQLTVSLRCHGVRLYHDHCLMLGLGLDPCSILHTAIAAAAAACYPEAFLRHKRVQLIIGEVRNAQPVHLNEEAEADFAH